MLTALWRRVRAVWRLLRAAGHVFRGLAVVYLRFPFMGEAARAHAVTRWSVQLLELMGMTLHVQGRPRPGAKLLVANHVSWLDIMAIDAVQMARFVSKAEVGDWPLVGRLVTAGGTLYLKREKRRDAKRVLTLMSEALAAGGTLAVFPEGTTGEGRHLLAFHGNLLQSAIDAHVPVQPVALRYADAQHAVSPAPVYVGETSLVESLWWIAKAEGLRVHVHVLTAMETAHADRRALAHNVRELIAEELVRIDAASGHGDHGRHRH